MAGESAFTRAEQEALSDLIEHAETVRWDISYGDPFPGPNNRSMWAQWWRFKSRWRSRGRRIRDAWAVLRGKADIDDGW